MHLGVGFRVVRQGAGEHGRSIVRKCIFVPRLPLAVAVRRVDGACRKPRQVDHHAVEVNASQKPYSQGVCPLLPTGSAGFDEPPRSASHDSTIVRHGSKG